jgi:hypothetical protein
LTPEYFVSTCGLICFRCVITPLANAPESKNTGRRPGGSPHQIIIKNQLIPGQKKRCR